MDWRYLSCDWDVGVTLESKEELEHTRAKLGSTFRSQILQLWSISTTVCGFDSGLLRPQLLNFPNVE